MTHTERVLNLLSDGEVHSHREGYRLGVMFHSRVADLRKKGYAIACWREGDEYLYQLGSLEPAEEGTSSSGSSERAAETGLTNSSDTARDPSRARSPHVQLTLEAA